MLSSCTIIAVVNDYTTLKTKGAILFYPCVSVYLSVHNKKNYRIFSNYSGSSMLTHVLFRHIILWDSVPIGRELC